MLQRALHSREDGGLSVMGAKRLRVAASTVAAREEIIPAREFRRRHGNETVSASSLEYLKLSFG
jgi:hypothetical protein